ncbi:hypothetical protein SAMN04488513_10212 [Pseudozobellia thermophila]|uniref:Uncharacterized protein n=1 Tax=Pseudozobellia thermophila TaxID=192903 RepID=A0A1M6EC83_9FLAO|nr:hypothetical protein SAMN04488513_10212 [Pseudozobellia thermophila]
MYVLAHPLVYIEFCIEQLNTMYYENYKNTFSIIYGNCHRF